MKAIPRQLAPELVSILHTEEMRGEQRVNGVRFWFCLLSLAMLVSVLHINRHEANVVFVMQTVAWLLFSVGMWAYFRRAGLRYVPGLKYVSITVDQLLLALAAVGMAHNHVGMLEYYQGFMPLTWVLWNIVCGLRYSMRACLYSAALSVVINGSILAWATSSGAIDVSPTSVYGQPSINLEDQIVAIVFMALPGVVAGYIARFARNLVVRAEGEAMKRSQIEGQRDRLRKYLSTDLAEVVLADPGKLELGGSRRQATIMFTDIRNFTPLSEQREPEDVVRLLNAYFTRMVEIVFRYGGTLDKFMGDGLMAVFGVPFDQPDSALRAVLVALEMQAAVEEFNEELALTAEMPAVKIGIGIATGPVVAGNIGSLQRMEYTCIGDTVNYASRLQGLNRDVGSTILLAEATGEEVEDIVPLRRTPELRVKGRGAAARPWVLNPAALDKTTFEGIRRAVLGGDSDHTDSGSGVELQA